MQKHLAHFNESVIIRQQINKINGLIQQPPQTLGFYQNYNNVHPIQKLLLVCNYPKIRTQ